MLKVVDLNIGETIKLRAEVIPSNATKSSVSWNIKGSEYIDFKPNGADATVRALRSLSTLNKATVEIEASAGGKKDIFKINIRPNPIRISFNSFENTLLVGQTSSVLATVYPADANQAYNLSLESNSNPKAAELIGSNQITAIAEGTVTIKATAARHSNVTATKVMTVIDNQVYALACSTSGSNFGILPLEHQEANARYIYSYLSDKGWSKNAICAFLGNIEQESVLNPGAWEEFKIISNDRGYGLIQWTPPTAFLNSSFAVNVLPKYSGNNDAERVNTWATSSAKSLMDSQLECLIWECQPTTHSDYRAWWPTLTQKYYDILPLQYDTPNLMTFAEYISSTHDTRDLTLVFHATRLRSGDNATILQKRIDNSKKWSDFFK